MSAKDWGYIAPQENAPQRLLTDVNRVDQAQLDMMTAEAEQMGFADAVSTAFTTGGNVAYQAYQMWDEINNSGPADPAWEENVEAFIKNNRIDPASEWRFRATANETEATKLHARMLENERGRQMIALRGGVSSFVAEMLAGIIDIDAPLMLATGGLSSLARTGYQASKLSRIASGGLQGGLASGAVGAGSVAVNPNDDWSILPAMLLGGTALGSVGGALTRGAKIDPLTDQANRTMQEVQEEIGINLATGNPQARAANTPIADVDPYMSRAWNEAEDALAEPPAPRQAPGAFRVEEVAPTGADSAGAARVPGTGKRPLSEIRSERIQGIVRTARDRDKQLGLENQLDEFMHTDIKTILDPNDRNLAQNVARWSAVKFSKIAQGIVGNDFNRIVNTDTATGRVLAYDLFESPAGIYRNNDNGARHHQDYKTRLLANVEPDPDVYQAWARRRYNANVVQANTRQDYREEFNREVLREMSARFYGRTTNAEPEIKKAADMYDKLYGQAADFERGRPGQLSVKGAENLQPKSGYHPQIWSGGKMRQLIEGGRSKDDITDAILESYIIRYPSMNTDDLRIYARAVVDRALQRNDGSSSNIVSWINADGRQAVEDFLARQTGIKPDRAAAIIDGLTSARQEAGKAGYLKERMDIDFDFRASNGIDMLDLVDTDIRGIAERRAHKSAGQAALARKGITSRADYEAIVDAIVQEQNLHRKPPKNTAGTQQAVAENIANSITGPKHMSREDLMELYNYFVGAPLYGGVSPVYAAAKKMANLSLLQQLGMAQMAEWGTNMAAIGIRSFFRKLPEAFKASMRKHDSPLMQDMRQLGVYIPDDRIHRFDQTYATEKLSADDTAWMARLNAGMNQASRLQGFTSLFYTMNRAQHHMAVDVGTTKLMRHLKGEKAMSDLRLRDIIGDDPALAARLKHYAENVVEYNGHGDVTRMHFDQWSIDDVESFSRAINAYTRQQVQRAMIGESNAMFHKDGFTGLFWHLKSFPLLALEKQFARNAIIGDSESMTAFLYGLGWASLAYTTKQVLNGNTDNLDYDKIALGTINMSNMSGWLPMWSDPILAMFGMDQYGLGFQGPKGTSIISVPAVFPALDRLAQVPGAILGDGSSSDIRAIQALPIVGNAYGIAALMNHMKDGATENRRRERREAREQEAAQEETNPITETFSDLGFAM